MQVWVTASVCLLPLDKMGRKRISSNHVSFLIKVAEPDIPVKLTSRQDKEINTNNSQSVSAFWIISSQVHGLSTDYSQWGGTFIDASKLNLILKSERKEQPFFRGDSTDKYPLCEWEGYMRGYLDKSSYTGRKRGDELVSRLLGHASDVIRIWRRNNVQVSDSGNVDAAFWTLRQHSDSAVYSGMPLADSHSPTPYVNEHPLDFWIRLNKAAERAEQSLKNGSNLPLPF